MSFYKRSFHSFLGQINAKTMPFKDEETSGRGHDDIIGSFQRDPGGIGFADEANGLMLCTEYLGFESYDMRMSGNEVEDKMTCHAEVETKSVETKRRKTKENVVARERRKEFPPPLSSLNGRGQRSFYLRPVRKDGRLELTQVMINRPEIFHASRENGRLRLHLVNGVGYPMRYCESEETLDLEDEPKGRDNENEGENISRSDLESGREINEDSNVTSDQVVDLSMVNDNSGHEVSLNSDNDVAHFHDDHDMREWRNKSCFKIVASRNYDQNDYHHQHHHHIHPYHHHTSNNNMHLWTQTYVKTR